jgi:DNA polymerase-1
VKHDLPDWKLTLVESSADVDAFLGWVEGAVGMVSIDTETHGLDWTERDFTRLVTFADDHQGWAVPVRWWGRPLAAALARLRDKGNPVAFWNVRFDMHALEGDGFPVPHWANVHDGMVLHHLLAPHVGHSLKGVSAEVLGRWATTGQNLLKARMAERGWDWSTVPVDEPAYWQYGVLDTLLTQRLVRELTPEVEAAGMLKAYEREMHTAAIMYRAEVRGMRIDHRYAEQTRRAWLARSIELRDHLAARGVTNPNSNQQLERVFRDLGWEPDDFTETGQAALDKIVLGQLAKRHPDIAPQIIEYKRLTKWIGAYLEPFAASKGRVHPSINTLRAKTGRMSITNPALQTLPSKGSGGEIRRCVLPEPGCELWAIDYDSQEARVVACLAGDEGLLDAFRAGEDMYTHIARMAWNDPTIGKGDARRSTAKVIMLALLYGAGPSTLAASSGLSVLEVQRFLASVYAKFPGIREATGDFAIGGTYPGKPALMAEKRASTEGLAYVMTRGGRRFSMPDGEYYKAVNGLAQGSSADMLKDAIIRLDRAGLSDTLIVVVHDELVLNIPTGESNMAYEIRALMEDDSWEIPMTADVEGPFAHWGEAYA